MSHVFCARCNRVRLTAEGYLKPCLHNPAGTDLRTPLRTGMDDAALTALLRRAIEQNRPATISLHAKPARLWKRVL